MKFREKETILVSATSEVRYVEVIVDKRAIHVRVTLY